MTSVPMKRTIRIRTVEIEAEGDHVADVLKAVADALLPILAPGDLKPIPILQPKKRKSP